MSETTPTSVAPDDLHAVAARLQTAMADLRAVTIRQSDAVATPGVAATLGIIGADVVADLYATGCRQTQAMDELAVRLATAGLAVRAASIDYADTDHDTASTLRMTGAAVLPTGPGARA
ncbi:hypothetical protein [Williamsia sp. CHRR-6]|uniref:hypothetical protein n=1 Tax=Williamsia sp. CHRR-6 TaxID=2835871 RepID=UPI001BD9E963|nr:hypothetical protein [Williamsia sp. CHRR-6]MBT0566829.1 hypothetical protein [Williamsia sp. CHRR-6]